MWALTAVSLIWAFSFGLIGHILRGVNPQLLAAVRLLIAFLVFIPLCRPGRLPWKQQFALLGIGAIQYGIMYITLFESYRHLASHEVALFTVFTPLYVTLIHDALTRRFHRHFFAAALLAVGGTAIIKWQGLESAALWKGFLLMQISNLCFAYGQTAYRHIMRRHCTVTDHSVFALLYLGAVLTALPAALLQGGGHELLQLTAPQWATLLYLGGVASGLAFFLWNYGARRVDAGALAVFNNLKVPLAMTVSIAFFGETAHWPRLLIGGTLVIAALLINEKLFRSPAERNSSK